MVTTPTSSARQATGPTMPFRSGCAAKEHPATTRNAAIATRTLRPVIGFLHAAPSEPRALQEQVSGQRSRGPALLDVVAGEQWRTTRPTGPGEWRSQVAGIDTESAESACGCATLETRLKSATRTC